MTTKSPELLAVERLDALRNVGSDAASGASGPHIEGDHLIPVGQEAADAIYALAIGGKSIEEIARVHALPVEVVSATIAAKADAALAREAAQKRVEAALALARVDAMLDAIWPDVLAGDRHTIRLALEIEGQRRTLRGLDAKAIEDAARREEEQAKEQDPALAELVEHLTQDELELVRQTLSSAKTRRAARKPRQQPQDER